MAIVPAITVLILEAAAGNPFLDKDKYYFHMFAKEQPDLNWENPVLRNKLYQMINWWLEKGLAGFLSDAIINIKIWISQISNRMEPMVWQAAGEWWKLSTE